MIYDQQDAHRAGVRFEYASWGFGDLECDRAKVDNESDLVVGLIPTIRTQRDLKVNLL